MPYIFLKIQGGCSLCRSTATDYIFSVHLIDLSALGLLLLCVRTRHLSENGREPPPCVSPLPPAENDDAQKSRSPLFLLMSLWNTPEIRRFCLYHDSFLWSCSPSPWIFIVNQKVLPFPSSLSTPYCAPCSSRMPLTMLNPMPDPSFARTCALCPL